MSCLTKDDSAHRLSKTNQHTQKHGLKGDREIYDGVVWEDGSVPSLRRLVAGVSPHIATFDPTAVRVGLVVRKATSISPVLQVCQLSGRWTVTPEIEVL